MAEILLHDGSIALVDDADFEHVKDLHWYKSAYGYAVLCNGVTLHRKLIGQPPKGFVTDHKNEDKLDCRRNNLRFVTRKLNNLNCSKRKWVGEHQGKWRVRFILENMRVDVSGIETKAEADSIAALLKGSLIYHELTKGEDSGLR
jgi:HNH endonuclease